MSGSIRYVHQDCLLEWLKHSNKRYCELCKHSFSFTPIYSPEMPEVIPMRVLMGRVVRKLVKVTRFFLRGILVAFIWLVMLPYFTIWVWRLYFWIGETFAYKANGLETPMWNSTTFFASKHNLTSTLTTTTTTTFFPENNLTTSLTMTDSEQHGGIWFLLLQTIAPEHQWVSKFILDCFEGQIISSLVFVVFVALFLLREWVLQNQPGDRGRVAMDDPAEPAAGQEVDAPDFIVEHAVERLIAVQHHVEAVVEGDADFTDDSDSDSDSGSDSDNDHEDDDGDQDNDQIELAAEAGEGEWAAVQPMPDVVPHVPPPAPVPQPQVLPLPPPPARLPGELNDDIDDFNLEELDGILEVIGMHGSFWQLVQNSLLMSALVCASLGAGIWIPFMIGKTMLLMSPLKVLRLPLSVLGRLTDPILDYFFDHVLPYSSATISKTIATYNLRPLEVLYQGHILPVWNTIIEISASGITQEVNSKEIPVTGVDSLDSGQQVANATDPTMMHHFVQKWTEVAHGTSSGDRFAAIITGYVILLALGFWCFMRIRNTSRHTFARTIRDALRQQGLVLKIAFFVAYEMLVFPLLCGIAVSLSILPIFKDSSIASRIAFFKISPNWSLIMHWVIGTAFTYGFALFVRSCRRMVRPGAMWFLRDPNDEGVHPAREILERPALAHLRTLTQATVLYFGLILLGVTLVTHSINLLLKGVLPLRWPVDDPLSDVPIDMLLFHLVFPFTARWLNPTARLKTLFAAWLQTLARWLRLSSFLYSLNGQRFLDEEGHFVYRSWKAWLLRWRPPIPGMDNRENGVVGSGEELDIDAPVIFVRDGGLLRVPNTDLTFHLKDRPMLVAVDEQGNALDPREDLPGEIDPLEEFRTRGRVGPIDPKENTVVIYAPPYFKYRMAAFVVIIWISVTTFLALSVVTPMVAGRAIFGLKTERHVQDIYSIIVGLYFLRGLWYVLDWVTTKIQEVASHGLQPIDTIAQISSVWRLFKLSTKVVYFGLTFGVLMPFLLGFMVELYVFLPLRSTLNDDYSMAFMVNWAVGLLYLKAVHRTLGIFPNNRFAVDTNRVFNGTNVNNWDAMIATRRLVLPFIGISAVVITGPLIPALFVANFFDMKGAARLGVIAQAYPIALALGLGAFCFKEGLVILRGWSQYVRDQEYLVGRQLHNLQEDVPGQVANDMQEGQVQQEQDQAEHQGEDQNLLELQLGIELLRRENEELQSMNEQLHREHERLLRTVQEVEQGGGEIQESPAESHRQQETQEGGYSISTSLDEPPATSQEDQSLMEVELDPTTIRRTRLYEKRRGMSCEPELELEHSPLLRSNSRRVKDPPLWSDEDDDGGSIASRTRLGRIRRSKAQGQGA
ncbi:hypothetical protein BGX31_007432 [Mortierella sp. GBA43]|nr:hypothetical protein BGX31_007432 [Mortierella sp. GBA43]